MTSNSQILSSIGKDLISEIDSTFSSKDINNTNQASDSLKEESNETNLKIKGVGYIRFLDIGRKPGKFAPVEVIQDWVRSKLGIADIKENKQVAFLINRKLALKGNSIYIDKSTGLELEKIKDLGVEKIKQELGKNLIVEIKSEINNLLVGMK